MKVWIYVEKPRGTVETVIVLVLQWPLHLLVIDEVVEEGSENDNNSLGALSFDSVFFPILK
jgi:hypothetical protein